MGGVGGGQTFQKRRPGEQRWARWWLAVEAGACMVAQWLLGRGKKKEGLGRARVRWGGGSCWRDDGWEFLFVLVVVEKGPGS